MSDEKIIEVLEDLWKYEHSKFSEKEIREALEKGIEALKNQNSIIKELEKIKEEFENKEGVFTSYHVVKAIDEHIAELKEGDTDADI